MTEPYREVTRTTRADGTEIVVVEATNDPAAPPPELDAPTPAANTYSVQPSRFIVSVVLVVLGTLAMIVGVGMSWGWWEALTVLGVVTLVMGFLLGYDGTD